MKIVIEDSRRIQDLQMEFNKVFPYLKIEFFTKSHKPGGPSAKNLIVNKNKTLGDCRKLHNSGSITITPEMAVVDLEQNFNQIYGLSVQVFRRSGEVWLETTVTDSWTLGEQNYQGEMLSKYIEEKSKTEDR